MFTQLDANVHPLNRRNQTNKQSNDTRGWVAEYFSSVNLDTPNSNTNENHSHTSVTISKLRKGVSQHPSRSKKDASNLVQLPLFNTVVTEVRIEPVLVIESVPPNTALGVDRYYLAVHQGSQNWHFPIQWTLTEAKWFLVHLRWMNWSLDEDTGYPVQIELIYASVETLFEERNESLGSSP